MGDLAEIRGGLVGGEAAEETREGGRRARQVLELGVQRGLLDVRQADDVGVRGGGDARIGFVEDQALNGQVAHGALHVAAPDLHHRRAVDECAGEVGEGLQGAA